MRMVIIIYINAQITRCIHVHVKIQLATIVLVMVIGEPFQCNCLGGNALSSTTAENLNIISKARTTFLTEILLKLALNTKTYI